ncbi:unnamed protein product [Peniophora sp. CBMAI 1063]|nr:unnamed protein product [Peniophora sp. CBMAI 1063]
MSGLALHPLQSPSAPSNSDAPIHTLPAELLVMIFVVIADNIIDIGRTKAPPCMFLSHVCGRWRTVALACQELWSTFLPRKSVKWTEDCLGRCPSIPLEVSIDMNYAWVDGSIEATALVMQHWARISNLRVRPAIYPSDTNAEELSEGSQAILETLFGFLARPTECLEALELDMSCDFGVVNENWIPVALPQHLFGSLPPPRLHRLKLTLCRLPATPPLQLFAPSLRSLELVNAKAWPDIDTMVAYLQTVPLLESLTYQFWLESDDNFDCRPSRNHRARCVHLPNLRKLYLNGLWTQNIAIFSYIAIPSRCDLASDYHALVPIDDSSSVATVMRLITIYNQALTEHLAPAISNGAFYSYVEISDYGVDAELETETRLEQIKRQKMLLPPELKGYFCLPLTEVDIIVQAAFRTFLTQPILTNADRLAFNAEAWRHCPDAFDRYSAVREVLLEECEGMTAFTSALRLRGASLFPNLRRIVLHRLSTDQALSDSSVKLAEAIRDTHVADGSFERIELEHCDHVTESVDNAMIAVLGANRVVRNQPLMDKMDQT